MEPGQSSGSQEGDDLWAKLVPADSRYSEIEIRSQESVVCSETKDSSSEKRSWCEIAWSCDSSSAKIRNLSPHAIIVDGIAVGEEALDIECGSEIISGPIQEGYLSYTFRILPTQKQDMKTLKISLDVDHAKCSICLSIWHDVVTVSPCLHNFCNGCFSEWLRKASTQSHDKHQGVVCPQCRTIVHSVGRNHFLHNIEQAVLQSSSSLRRSDEEIALLDSYASIKSNLVLEMQKKLSRKRPLSFSTDERNIVELPCPQCGGDHLGGFRCGQSTSHLQCQGCGGMMPSRPDIGVPQHCLGCNRSFCGAYWLSQGVNANESIIICNQQTFKPIVERSISRIPDSSRLNNYEKDVTNRCIQQTGKTLQAVISDWIVKFNNRQIDRSSLQISHAETITSGTHLCNDCYHKLVDYLLYWFRISMPPYHLPPDAKGREDCWYGYSCRTQHHNNEHARRRNHVCRPTRGYSNS